MKNFLFITFFLSLTIIMNIIDTSAQSVSQSFTFVSRDTLIKGGLSDEFTAYAIVKNKAFTPRTLGLKMNFIKYNKGDSYSLCWGLCTGTIDAGIDTSLSYTIHLDYNKTSGNNFAAHFFPAAYGTTKIAYTFYNTENPDDNLVDTVTFIAGETAVQEVTTNLHYRLFPNPTTDWIEFTVDNIFEYSTMNIYNFIGILVKSIETPPSRIDVRDLPAGAYFVRIINNGKESSGTSFLIQK
jgi:hypothetical protein